MFPLIPLIGAGAGLIQSIGAGRRRHNAEVDLENQAKNFQPNASILDFYNKALAKYNPNPYTSTGYQQQQNQIGRNLSTGLAAAQNRRMGLGAIGGLVQQANDSSARAAAQAESMGRQDLGQLAQASQMKTNEQQKKFDMMYNLAAQKAGAAAQTQNTGLQNLFGGLNNAATMVDQFGWDGKKDPYGRYNYGGSYNSYNE